MRLILCDIFPLTKLPPGLQVDIATLERIRQDTFEVEALLFTEIHARRIKQCVVADYMYVP